MIEAINSTIVASVLIQGRLSAPISLKRSLRQGCPLSPFLFLIVANALSLMIFKVVEEGLIKRVPIEEIGDQYTHSQFVDDTSVIIEAKIEYVDATFQIFRCMGRASGLFIKEGGVKTILISEQAMPIELLALD